MRMSAFSASISLAVRKKHFQGHCSWDIDYQKNGLLTGLSDLFKHAATNPSKNQLAAPSIRTLECEATIFAAVSLVILANSAQYSFRQHISARCVRTEPVCRPTEHTSANWLSAGICRKVRSSAGVRTAALRFSIRYFRA